MNSEKDQESTSKPQECVEANCFCDKVQYQEAEFWEKTKLQLHLLQCPACREYSAKNKWLTKLFEKVQLNTLTEEEHLQLKHNLQKQLDR